jgi:anti-sigma B factor antagonist
VIDGLSVTVASLDGVVRLAVGGEIDVNTADRFERALREAVFEAGSTVALDLSLVPFMGKAGISALVHARNLAVERGPRWRSPRSPPRWSAF